MQLRNLLKVPLRKLGYDIVKLHRTTPTALRRQRLFEAHRIDLVLDVGAHTGQYVVELRRNGYKGRIVSFEPLSLAYRRLTRTASGDVLWKTVKLGLGDQNTTASINISRNEYSSSLLSILPKHLQAEPESKYIGAEEITVRTLDSILPDYLASATNIYLKIDTQGFERRVIEGARNSLNKICGIQMEMSLAPLYENESLFPELLQLMFELGYDL